MSSFKPIKILHIELSDTIPSLQPELGIQGLHIIFWWHDIPLGQQQIPALLLPMSAPQILELALKAISPTVVDYLLKDPSKPPGPVKGQLPDEFLDMLLKSHRPLQKISESLSLSKAKAAGMSTSVVVCTRDRPEQLERCLRSLQKLSRSTQEILVVDNAPISDATRLLVAQMPGIRYILEPRPGLSAARNTGIRCSTGDIIAFTDDDVIAHPDWITRLEQGFADPDVMVVTGLVLPAELETEAQFIFESHSSFNLGYRTRVFDIRFFERTRRFGVPVWSIGAGANMAIRRRAFELLGNFDERLGAGTSGCSEDSEFWYRVLAEGWLCRYEPASVVYHHHRADLNSLNDQMYQYMRGHMAALLIQFEKYRHWGNLYRAFGIIPRHYLRLLARALRGCKPDLSILRSEVLGCMAGIKFYLRHMRRKAFQNT
jgi:GT2 family glycosyltransferase